MALKRFALYGAATLTALTLANCGGGSEDEVSDGRFSRPDEIRDALTNTDYECVRWDMADDKMGRCSLDKYTNTPNHWVTMSDDPQLMAVMGIDDDPDNVGSAVGDNWVFDCGADLSVEQCREVADILGGEHIDREDWS